MSPTTRRALEDLAGGALVQPARSDPAAPSHRWPALIIPRDGREGRALPDQQFRYLLHSGWITATGGGHEPSVTLYCITPAGEQALATEGPAS